MHDLRGTYVHRGDLKRRRERVKRTIVGVACCTAALMVYENQKAVVANAASAAGGAPAGPAVAIRKPLAARGQMTLANEQLVRWNQIFSYSNRYNIGAQLAGAIHDIAIDEGLEPELAFRLVRTESEFKEHATSHVGAVGLTQLMPATARYFQKGITREKLYDRETNLRIGFRYLRTLIREYDGDVGLALLVYNRGPVAVERLRRAGEDPSNGYDRKVLAGYNGDGIVE